MAERRAQAPRTNVGIDVKALPIGPEEAFVLSRVDGHTHSLDIAHSTGLPLERVLEILASLEQLGAVSGLDGVKRISHSPNGATTSTSAGDPKGDARSLSTQQHDVDNEQTAPSDLPGFVVVPDLDLSADEQATIWRAWRSLDQKDHYAILGVARNASRDEIRQAYFEHVATVHPDKHFGRRLGTYKQKLEMLFQRLTTAHETLSRTRRREAYDSALAEQAGTRAPSSPPRARPSTPPPAQPKGVAPVGPVSAPPVASRSAPTSASSPSSVPFTGPRSPRPRMVAPAAAVPLAASSAPPSSAQERRQEALRSLERGLNAVGRASPGPRAGSLPPASIRGPVIAPVGADPATALERARQAETSGEWLVAAHSYVQAGERADDPHCFNRAAECFRQAASRATDGKLLRHAADNARRAVSLAPHNPQLRLTLSHIYAEAGMLASATREAEKAQELSPNDTTIQTWVQRVKRGDV